MSCFLKMPFSLLQNICDAAAAAAVALAFFTRFDHFIPHNGKLRAKRKKKPPCLCGWSFNRNFLQVKRYCGTLFGYAAEAS